MHNSGNGVNKLRFLTAGESHGSQLTAIIEGFPAGFEIDESALQHELWRRQQGYGRGNRMSIEQDKVQLLSGVRFSKTIGSPITMVIQNKDWDNWQGIMSSFGKNPHHREVTKPRPGHADLVGGLKIRANDLRDVLERSSARETAMRVAIGALCKQFLAALDITIVGKTQCIGGIEDTTSFPMMNQLPNEWVQRAEDSELRMIDPSSEQRAKQAIDEAKRGGYSLGGRIQIRVDGMPAGIGSYTHWDRKLDGRIAQAIMSVNAMKSVSFGDGASLASQPGYKVMDEIIWDETDGYQRASNHLGGIEGGMTNGMPIMLDIVMKPIPTQYQALRSVDIHTKKVFQASVERSDTCAVPAAVVVLENVVATTLTMAILDQFDDSQMDRLLEQWESYRQEMRG